MPTPVANTLHVNDSDQHLSAYLSSRIRKRIERDYYQRVSDQAHLDEVATNPVFLANPLQHVALYSDHGPVHARDVATQITAVLESVNGVAIPFRDSMRLEFMKGYGVLLAYAHDIGMKDFTAFGRAMHPEYAAQEVFTDGWDDIIDAAWNDNSGNVGWRLVMLGDALRRDPKLVLRELLSLAVGHSKSKVPIVILNDPQAVAALSDLAPGATREIPIGGRSWSDDAGPVVLQATVLSRSDGKFTLEDAHSHAASMSGLNIEMGPCTVIRSRGVTILLTSRKTPPFDLGQLHSQGLDPTGFAFIGVKAAVARIQVKHSLSGAKRDWLKRFQNALINDVILDPSALGHGEFGQHGGFARFDKIFDHHLTDILADLHDEIWRTPAA